MPSNLPLDIDYVASLARLALTADEKLRFSRQLGDVLGHFAQIARVDVSNVEASAHAAPVFNVWADDRPLAGLTVESALRNAPVQRDHMVVVPKVVE